MHNWLYRDNWLSDFENWTHLFKTLDVSPRPSISQSFPKFDIYHDKDGNSIIEIALAGYAKEQLSVEVDDGKLIISASKKDDKEDQHGRCIARRAFSKSFVDPTKMSDFSASEVSFVDGLLKIIIPSLKPTKEDKKHLIIK